MSAAEHSGREAQRGDIAATPLSVRLRDATRDLHTAAERAGMMPALLRGELPRTGYAWLLRNLHALYATLEGALARHAEHPCVASLRLPGLARAGALAADLDVLGGPAWSSLPVVDAMHAYCRRLDAIAQTSPTRLAAHVYVRYLGDLSGGQLLRGVVQRCCALPDGRGVAFYEFGDLANVAAARAALKRALDLLPCGEADRMAIVDEARDSFARHVALFEELAAAQPSRSLPAA